MDDLLKRIDDAIMKRAGDKPARSYLGASSLGEPCDRKLWYSYHQPKRILDPRINRIFDLGNLIEDYLVRLLEEAGLKVYVKDEEGKQFGFEDGVIAGNSDGVIVIDDIPMLLEFKSYNTKRFSALKKEGVRLSAPTYYTQVQVYMKYLELDKCLFIALDKNDSSLHFEIIDYDPIESNWAVQRGKDLVSASHVNSIPRKYSHVSHFSCKVCDYRTQCWKEDV